MTPFVSFRHLVLVSGVSLAVPCALAAQGTFIDGLGTTAYAVSDDGTVVAGDGGPGVYRWTTTGGLESVGVFPLLIGLAAMSADGDTISYDMHDSGGAEVGGYWTRANGWTEVGGLFGSCGSVSSAYDVSDDGSVVVGLAWDYCKGRAFRWDAVNGMVDLGLMGDNARANCVSGDGRTIGGWDDGPSGGRRAAVWWPDGSETLIASTAGNPEGYGEVWGMNRDASVIVGTSDEGAFRWTPTGGYQLLGTFPGATGNGIAYATNHDGSVIVGTIGSRFTTYAAFIWTVAGGMQPLAEYLDQQGVVVSAGTPLSLALDISPDGRFIVGRRGIIGVLPGIDGFYVELPDGIRYGLNAAPANTLDLAGTGSSALGDTFTATTTNVAGGGVATILGGSPTSIPFLGGMILVDLGLPVVTLSAPAIGGSASISIPIGNNPALAGASFYMQSLAPDVAAPAGGRVLQRVGG